MLRKLALCLLGVVCLTPLVLMAQIAPARAQDAKMAYTIYCSRCHGEGGDGNGPSAASLSTKPQNFTDCAAMKQKTDDTLYKAIHDGGAAVGLPPDMPAWGQGLDDKQIHSLIDYVRHFCKK